MYYGQIAGNMAYLILSYSAVVFVIIPGIACSSICYSAVVFNLQDNLQDLLLIASLHGQYDQNCLASIVVVLLPV